MLDLGRFMLMESLAFHRWVQAGATLPAEAVSAGPALEAQRDGAPLKVDRSGLAVVSVLGMTNKRFSYQPLLASYIGTSWAVKAAADDPKVKTILLKFDSPGGYVDGVAEAADDIARAAKRKRVVAQVDGLAASAAYWMASQATEIWAGRLDDVGSIGVLAVLYDSSAWMEENGIKPEVFSTGKYKWTGVPGTSLTDDQRDYIQDSVDKIGDAFVADVARGRRRSEGDIRKVADGRVFQASEALALGLIDGVRSYADTLDVLHADLAATSTRDSRIRETRLAIAEAVQKL